MEKKLIPALILTLLAGTAMAMDDAAKADKAMTGASSDQSTSNDASSARETTVSGAESGASNANAGRANSANLDANAQWQLTADPKTTLFLRLDTDKDGLLSNEEISAGKDLLTLDVSGANTASSGGVSLTDFKTALTNSMLGLGGTTTASSPTGRSTTASGAGSSTAPGASASGDAASSASADSDRDVQGADADSASGGMQSDQVMDEVIEEGGPTAIQGGPNSSPDALTPEQKLNNPAQ